MADAGSLPADVVRALQRTAVIAVAALAAGGIIVGAIAAFGHIDTLTIVGLPLAAAGYAGTFAPWSIQSRYAQLVRAPLADLALDRRRAVNRAVLRGDDTAAASLSWEELRRAVHFAQASLSRQVIATATSTLLFVGLFGAQLFLYPDDGVYAWIRAGLLIAITAVVIVTVPLAVVRVRRIRTFLNRNAHVLDAPADAD